MVRIRVFALVMLVLLAGSYGLRTAAIACTGTVCDWYNPFGALLPALVLTAGAVTGVLAMLPCAPGGQRRLDGDTRAADTA